MVEGKGESGLRLVIVEGADGRRPQAQSHSPEEDVLAGVACLQLYVAFGPTTAFLRCLFVYRSDHEDRRSVSYRVLLQPRLPELEAQVILGLDDHFVSLGRVVVEAVSSGHVDHQRIESPGRGSCPPAPGGRRFKMSGKNTELL